MTEHFYSIAYKDKVFAAWKSAGEVNADKLHEIIDVDAEGYKPSVVTLHKWIKEDFTPRAEIINVEAMAKTDTALIEQQVEYVNRMIDMGKKLQTRAMEYLLENDFTSSASAVSALKLGAELEGKGLGLADVIRQLSEKSDKKLLEEIEKLVNKISENADLDEVIDGETV